MVKINMDKAKDIKRDVIRLEREPEFSKLDIEYQKASERNDTAAMQEIADKKQKLRDAPATNKIEEAKTVEDLNRITLENITK